MTYLPFYPQTACRSAVRMRVQLMPMALAAVFAPVLLAQQLPNCRSRDERFRHYRCGDGRLCES